MAELSREDFTASTSAYQLQGEDWSSDEDAAATAEGYTLLRNESDDDEDQEHAPDQAELNGEAQLGDVEIQDQVASIDIDLSRMRPPMTAEEEDKLRREAFAQFDRNYSAEVEASITQVGRDIPVTFDQASVEAAFSTFTLDYRPSWGFDDKKSDEVLSDILRQHNIEWKNNSGKQ